MTPKEKAFDLVESYKWFACWGRFEDEYENKQNSKKCALIAVNEIMFWNPKEMLYTVHVHRFKTLQELDLDKCQFDDSMILEQMTALEYWDQVKNEIKKL